MTTEPLSRETRNQVLREARGRCERCGTSSKHGLEVHPLEGAPGAFEALCRDCRGDGVPLVTTPERVYLRLGGRLAATGQPWASMSEFKAQLQDVCRRHRVRWVPLHADKALSVLVKYAFPPPRPRAVVDAAAPAPLSRAEAADLWRRLCAKVGGTLKAIPTTKSRVRIDAPTTPDVPDLEGQLEGLRGGRR